MTTDRIPVENGKYEIVINVDQAGSAFDVLKCGQEWMTNVQEAAGGELILSMAYELLAARLELEDYEAGNRFPITLLDADHIESTYLMVVEARNQILLSRSVEQAAKDGVVEVK